MASRVKQNQRKGGRIFAKDAKSVGQALNQITQVLQGPRDLTGGTTDDPDLQGERGPAGPRGKPGEAGQGAAAGSVFSSERWLAIGASTQTVRFTSESDESVFVDVEQFTKITCLRPNSKLVTLDLRIIL